MPRSFTLKVSESFELPARRALLNRVTHVNKQSGVLLPDLKVATAEEWRELADLPSALMRDGERAPPRPLRLLVCGDAFLTVSRRSLCWLLSLPFNIEMFILGWVSQRRGRRYFLTCVWASDHEEAEVRMKTQTCSQFIKQIVSANDRWEPRLAACRFRPEGIDAERWTQLQEHFVVGQFVFFSLFFCFRIPFIAVSCEKWMMLLFLFQL